METIIIIGGICYIRILENNMESTIIIGVIKPCRLNIELTLLARGSCWVARRVWGVVGFAAVYLQRCLLACRSVLQKAGERVASAFPIGLHWNVGSRCTEAMADESKLLTKSVFCEPKNLKANRTQKVDEIVAQDPKRETNSSLSYKLSCCISLIFASAWLN